MDSRPSLRSVLLSIRSYAGKGGSEPWFRMPAKPAGPLRGRFPAKESSSTLKVAIYSRNIIDFPKLIFRNKNSKIVNKRGFAPVNFNILLFISWASPRVASPLGGFASIGLRPSLLLISREGAEPLPL